MAQLRAAYDAGALDRRTYDDRVSRALAATTESDLDQLVADVAGYGQPMPTFEPYQPSPRPAPFADTEAGIADPEPISQWDTEQWSQADGAHPRSGAMATRGGDDVPDNPGRRRFNPVPLAVAGILGAMVIFSLMAEEFNVALWIAVFLLVATASGSQWNKRK